MNNKLKVGADGKLKIGLFGFGCVGQGFYEIFTKHALDNVEIAAICVKESGKNRPLPESSFVFDKATILENPEIGMIVELISDADEAFEIVSSALKRGLTVISANKKMLAEHLYELIELQQLYNGTLLYEASSCGSIPVIRTLEDFFAYEEVSKIKGIFNGSSNFILTKISQDGLSYETALRQAQDLGFAEADPTLDVGGFDALNKLCVITMHAFGVAIHPQNVFNYGIQCLAASDNHFAASRQWKLKQVAYASVQSNGQLLAYVMPQFVEGQEELYGVDEEFNAVLLEAAFSGRQFLKGKGAGAHPTGAAVFSDFRSVLEGYSYRYPKSNAAYAALDNQAVIKAYARAKEANVLETLGFKTILEKGKVEDYAYVIGEIALSTLISEKPVLEEQHIFIAALPDQHQDFVKGAALEAVEVVKQ